MDVVERGLPLLRIGGSILGGPVAGSISFGLGGGSGAHLPLSAILGQLLGLGTSRRASVQRPVHLTVWRVRPPLSWLIVRRPSQLNRVTAAQLPEEKGAA